MAKRDSAADTIREWTGQDSVIHVRVPRKLHSALMTAISGKVSLSQWVRSISASWLIHERLADGRNIEYLRVSEGIE